MAGRTRPAAETAETMASKQRDISVSEFFLKNRHLLGFDSPRKGLLTAIKEAVDNALDACEEAGVLPEISVDVQQLSESRFRVSVTDNGPGILRAQIPKVFAKLLYGSKFHRLRMSRGQQGIGISAAGMYGQLTTGQPTEILSRVKTAHRAHRLAVQIDTRANKPVVLTDEECDWQPVFPALKITGERKTAAPAAYAHGLCVSITMEAAYARGRLSVDEYLKQCAIVNPHLQLHYRIRLLPREKPAEAADLSAAPELPLGLPVGTEAEWLSFERGVQAVPPMPVEIKPHPHGVELGMLMQMLKDTGARNVRAALSQDFSRVSGSTAEAICARAGIEPKAQPGRIPPAQVEALFKAIGETKLMRPPTDCLAPISEEQIVAGLCKEIKADFYTAVTRAPAVYRGNPFQIEAGLAYAQPGTNPELVADEPARMLRFANRVPLLYQAGACAIHEAMTDVNWKAYGLAQPKDGLPQGPLVVMVHMASVWVPFTSESKEAVAHYPEIVREMVFALQECGRRLNVFLSRRNREAEAERKRSYIEKYIPHLALGLREILALKAGDEENVKRHLTRMLEKTRLDI